MGELVASWVSHPIPADATGLVHALWQATEGNPLFVREEVRSLVEDGRWPDDGAATAGLQFGLTPRMRDVITRRLARLSGSTRNLLTIASDHRPRVRSSDSGAGVRNGGSGTGRRAR